MKSNKDNPEMTPSKNNQNKKRNNILKMLFVASVLLLIPRRSSPDADKT